MNKITKSFVGTILSIFVLMGLFAVAKPTPVSAAACDSRTITGYVITNGNDTNARFRYATDYSTVDNGGGQTTPTQTVRANQDQNIEAFLTGLSGSTQYFYRLEVKKTSSSNWGPSVNIENFTTPACSGTPTNPTFVNFDFRVRNSCNSNYIQNALVSINQDFGNGTTRTTDGSGFADFGVYSNTNIGWTVSASGFSSNSGSTYSGSSTTTTSVSLTPTGGCSTTPPPAPTNTLPKGYLDGADCSAIWGWSVDYNKTDTPVHIEVDDAFGRSVITGLANLFRKDVNDNLGLTGNHAFHIATPTSLKDGVPHIIYVYGVDVDSTGTPTGNRFLLNGSPKTITCNVVPPPPTTCQDPRATNYGGLLPCRYPSTPPQVCQTPGAINYGQVGTCIFPPIQPPFEPPTGNLTISPSSCTIGPNQSTCTTGATWSTQNVTSPAVVDRNTGNTLSTSANRLTPPLTVWVTFPSTTFDLKNGASILDTEVATASCASGTSWNGSMCVNIVVNQPSVNLTANPTSISSGDPTQLTLSSNNVTSCSANSSPSNSQWTGGKNINGTFSYTISNLTSTTTFSVTCIGTNGQQVNDSVTVNVGSISNNVSVDLTADDTRIDEGDDTRVRWTSNNASYCNRTGGRNGWALNNVGTSGTFDTGDLFSDTTYSITCYNNAGNSASDSVTVRVDDDDNGDRPTVNIYANPGTVNYNGSSVITWNSTDADDCRSSGGTSGWSSSNRGRSGTFYANFLTSDTTFNITCTNDEGSDSDSVTVRVGNNIIVNNNQPTVNLYADSTNIAYNAATFLRWNTTNATSCYASGGSLGWAGTKSIGPASFYTGSLSSSRTYTLTCSNGSGSATDSVTVNVRPRTVVIGTPPRPVPTSLVLITSSIDRNQPIQPTLDNTRPHVGDEINYTVTYQNIGTAAIRNLVLRLDLPREVDFMFSNPNNPMVSGNTLIFSLGTLPANGQGTVTVRVRVREDAPAGALLNFPAVLSYTDPAGFPQSVSANVSAQVWSNPNPTIEERTVIPLGASVFGAGFWPASLFGWLLFLILILVLVMLVRALFTGTTPAILERKTVTTTVQH